jgi:hypothetical protein
MTAEQGIGSKLSACERCGRRVISIPGFVTHLGEDGGLLRGCRAASFTVEDGWDDSLDKRWTAKMSKDFA